MILVDLNNKFKYNLVQIEKDILGFTNNKEQILKQFIKEKNDAALIAYKEFLTQTEEYLLSRDPIKVLKNIEREQEKEDKLDARFSND